jgi:calcineurin-like phosphoesterase family protein
MSQRDRFLTAEVLEQAIGILGEVSGNDDSLDDSDRDEISHVIDMLDRLVADGGLLILVPQAGQR